LVRECSAKVSQSESIVYTLAVKPETINGLFANLVCATKRVVIHIILANLRYSEKAELAAKIFNLFRIGVANSIKEGSSVTLAHEKRSHC